MYPTAIYKTRAPFRDTRNVCASRVPHHWTKCFGKGLFGHGSLLLFSDLRAFCQRYGGGKII